MILQVYSEISAKESHSKITRQNAVTFTRITVAHRTKRDGLDEKFRSKQAEALENKM